MSFRVTIVGKGGSGWMRHLSSCSSSCCPYHHRRHRTTGTSRCVLLGVYELLLMSQARQGRLIGRRLEAAKLHVWLIIHKLVFGDQDPFGILWTFAIPGVKGRGRAHVHKLRSEALL